MHLVFIDLFTLLIMALQFVRDITMLFWPTCNAQYQSGGKWRRTKRPETLSDDRLHPFITNIDPNPNPKPYNLAKHSASATM